MRRPALPILVLASGLGLAAPPVAHAAARGAAAVTDVVAVEVPVQVIKDGAPVRGLTADDFELFDGRKKQKLTGFEVLDAAAPAADRPASRPLPMVGRRHFLLLFDLAFSEPKSLVQAHQAVRDLVDKRLLPSDLVAVATYSTRGAQLLLGFTSDRAQIDRAIDTLGVPELVDRNPDPVRLHFAEYRDEYVSGQLHSGPRGALFATEMLERLEDHARDSEVADRRVQQDRVTDLARSFAELGRQMASVSGRKQVLYLSEGFDSALLLGTADPAEAEAFRRASETAGENLTQLDSDKIFGSTKNTSEVGRMLDELRRADCVVQAIDIGGLRADKAKDLGATRPPGQDALFLIANQTGGELYHDFNDLGEAMAQMLDRTSLTYVLAFQPEGLPRDGSYRELRVALKHPPRGVRVVARPGYYAPKPFTQQSPLERMLATGNAILGGQPGGAFGLAVLPAPLRPGNGEARAAVPVVLEVDGPGLLGDLKAGILPAEIYAYALDDKGSIADFFTQTLALDLAKVGAGLEHGGLKFFGHLDLPPGTYTLRVLVRNGRTGQSSLQATAVTVPATLSETYDLLPPLFAEPPGRWLLVRQAPRADGRNAAYPFVIRNQAYVPVALPILAAGEAAPLALAGYDLGAGELGASARVLAADGKELAPGELRLLGREAGGGVGPDRLLLTWAPPPLAPGDYRLIVTVTDVQGRARATTTPFRVPPRLTG